MFEHFGLKDAFMGLWKYKRIWILTGLIAIFMIGGIVYAENSESVKIANDSADITRYTSTRIIMFNSDKGQADELAVLYKDIFNGNECRKNVFNRMQQKYSKDELLEKLELPSNLSEDSWTENILANYASYTTLGKQTGVSVSVMTPDKELSEMIRDFYLQYLEESVNASEGIVAMSYLTEGNTEVLNKVVEQTNKYSAVKMKVVVCAMMLWLLSVIAIFFYTMFRPTVNRKEDFKDYEVKILGELSLRHRRER